MGYTPVILRMTQDSTYGRIYGSQTATYANIQLEDGGRCNINTIGGVTIDATAPATYGLKFYTTGIITTNTALALELAPAINTDLFLNPTGTGKIKAFTKTGHADQAVDGYITMLDSAGNALYLATLTPV